MIALALKIKKKIGELLEIPIEKIEEEKEISALHFNSFALIEFIEWVQDEYKVKISLEQFKKFKKLNDLFKYIENNLHK